MRNIHNHLKLFSVFEIIWNPFPLYKLQFCLRHWNTQLSQVEKLVVFVAWNMMKNKLQSKNVNILKIAYGWLESLYDRVSQYTLGSNPQQVPPLAVLMTIHIIWHANMTIYTPDILMANILTQALPYREAYNCRYYQANKAHFLASVMKWELVHSIRWSN